MDAVTAALGTGDPGGLTDAADLIDYAVAVLGVEAGWTREQVENAKLSDIHRMLIWVHQRYQ